MKPLARALDSWTPQALRGAPHEPHLVLAAGWGQVVGEDIARHCWPVRVAAQTLTIVTRSNAWSQQLSFFEERILTAVRLRLPDTAIRRLRFKVGKVPGPSGSAGAPRPPGRLPSVHPEPPQPAANADEAVERFHASVDARRRAKRSAGWKECTQCGALIAPRGPTLCIACANARALERDAAAARLLFEAPWLGYVATAAMVDGLSRADYETLRTRLLARWWEILARARAGKRLSRDERERLIASSYVVLKSKLPPEEIEPATVRSVLGDELHDLLYGTER